MERRRPIVSNKIPATGVETTAASYEFKVVQLSHKFIRNYSTLLTVTMDPIQDSWAGVISGPIEGSFRRSGSAIPTHFQNLAS